MLGAAPRWFVEGTRVGGATAYAPPGATIGGEYTSPGTRAPRGFAAQGFRRPGVSPLAMVHRAYSPAGYPMRSNTGGPVHPFGPGGPFGGRMPLRPGGSPAQGFALGYGPAALQAAPGTCIRYGHSGPGARLVGRMPLRPGVSPPGVSPPRGFAPGYGPAALQAAPGYVHSPRRGGPLFILPADGCRDCRRRRRAFRASYRPRPASWGLSASRHRASSVPSVPWAA